MDSHHTGRTENAHILLATTVFGWGGYDHNTILGAFAGSIIFIVSATDFLVWTRLALFTASMMIGITSADFTASLSSLVLNEIVQISICTPVPVGAMIAAAVSARCLMYISNRPQKLLSMPKDK